MLVDLENLCWGRDERGPRPGDGLLDLAWTVVGGITVPHWAVVVGDRHLAARVICSAARIGLRVYAGEPGPNRADRELVDRATTDLPSHVETVVLVSGDGDFVPLVLQQQSRGLQVGVVSWKQALSGELAAVADHVELLDDHLDLAA